MFRPFLARGCVLAAMLALAPPALGAAHRSRLTVTAPATARVNRSVKLLFRGYAARPANELVIYLDDVPCAATGRAEGKRSEVRAVKPLRGLSQSFSVALTVSRSASGTHYVCGYVESHRLGRTYARGSARYVTH